MSDPALAVIRKNLSFRILDEMVINTADETLCRTIDVFMKDLTDIEKLVFASRFSYNAPYKTLSETASLISDQHVLMKSKKVKKGKDYTRERIRQIQVKLIEKLRDMLAPYQSVLRNVIWNGYDLLSGDFMPKLQSRIMDDADKVKSFNRFLAHVGGFDVHDIDRLCAFDIKDSLLDGYWVSHSPNGRQTNHEQVADIANYLERFGLTLLGTRNYLYHQFMRGNIKYNPSLQRIEPCNLNKACGFAHATHAFNRGAGWKQIQTYVNARGFLGEKRISEERLDYGAGFAVEKNWIYQSARGKYAPIANFYKLLGDKDPFDIVDDVHGYLKRHLGEIGQLPLSVYIEDHGKKVHGIDDYFVMRHLVKYFGDHEAQLEKNKGVFFQGMSGSDTISIDGDTDMRAVSKKDVILEYFADGRSFKIDQVTPLLRSGSSRHAAYLVDCLIRDGELIKVEKGTYAITGDSNEGLSIRVIMKLVQKYLIENPFKHVSYDEIYDYLQKTMGDTGLNNASHLVSIVRSNHESYPGEWYFSSNHVSLAPPGSNYF